MFVLVADDFGDAFEAGDIGEQPGGDIREAVDELLLDFGKHFAGPGFDDGFGRQRDVSDGREHGGQVDFPGIVEGHLLGDFVDEAAQFFGAPEGPDIHRGKDFREQLDAAAEGFVEEFLFGRDQPVDAEGVIERLAQDFRRAGFGEKRKICPR